MNSFSRKVNNYAKELEEQREKIKELEKLRWKIEKKKAEEDLDKELTYNCNKHGLPKSAFVMKQIATYMLETGMDCSMATWTVKQDMENYVKDFMEYAKREKIKQFEKEMKDIIDG